MLTPNYDHDIPEMTVEVAKAAFPKGNAVMKIRDELGSLFADDDFVALGSADFIQELGGLGISRDAG